MDSTHIHLLLNHVAILGVIFSFLLFLAGEIFHSSDLSRAAMVGFLVAGIATFVTFRTGEGAEESVEHIPGVSESIIHEHEESAEGVIWVSGALAVLSLAGLYMSVLKKQSIRAIKISLLILGAVAAVWLFQVGRLGGLIRHTELSNSAVQQTDVTHGEEDHDD